VQRQLINPYGHHLHWRILNGPASLELDQVGNIALSPDGQQVAYQQGEQPSGGDVFVYREGRLDLIQIDPNQRGGQGSTQKLLWGPMAWRVLHTP